MNETWKPVPGYEGEYEVSDLGRVRSLDRFIEQRGSNRSAPHRHRVSGRVLRPGRSASGHVTVALGRKGGSKTVHSLVMLAFVGPPPSGCEVCHSNGDPSDNRLCNLRYDTRSANNIDASKAGTRGHLNAQQVRALRAASAYPGGIAVLADDFGVRVTTASNAAHGRSYRWVE